jgi:SAM-dependent methyltransferase
MKLEMRTPMTDDQARREAGAAIFAEDDVARCYYARPAYAPALYDFLLARVAGRGRALDLGCGPGKVAMVLAGHFGKVVALDPSAAMIAAGKASEAGRRRNIVWVNERAETYEDDAGFDLVTAGTSIHWPDPAVLFPKLAGWTATLAVLTDAPLFPAPAPPCGEAAWIEFLTHWLARMGRPAPVARQEDATAEKGPHEAWMDIAGRELFRHIERQSVEDFITSQHSRVSWSRASMGKPLADDFDRALDDLMRPFATNGRLDLEIASELTWGAPRATARP